MHPNYFGRLGFTTALVLVVSPLSEFCLAQGARDEALTAVEEAIGGDEYDEALRLIVQGERAARAARDADLQRTLQELRRRVGPLREGFQEIQESLATLARSPQDEAANTAVGRFYCMTKGDWEKGLPFLAKGEDGAFRDAARLDLAGPEEVVRQVATADAWTALVDEFREPVPRERLQLRARHWLLQALEQKDDAQPEIERRLDELELYPHRIVIWNTHNGNKNDRGTLAARVILFNGQERVWQNNVSMEWVKDVPTASTIWLPRRRFDQVRIEVVRWYHRGGGLAELEVYYDSEILSQRSYATASAAFDATFTPDRITDGNPGDMFNQEGLWLLPDDQAGWVQIHLNRR